MSHQGAAVEDEIASLSLAHNEKPPVSRRIGTEGSGVVLVNVKDKFLTAVQALDAGDVVKDGFFSLFESVAALEIMDPKMDSGCVAAGDEFEELYDLSRRLTPEEVIGVIDQLICHEVSWHLGYPLSQTVFTSVYCEALLDPEPQDIASARFVRTGSQGAEAGDLMMDVLRVYCLGMLKTCFYVNERVKSEHYYEEEDFVTNTYHRSLLENIPKNDIQLRILEVENKLRSDWANLKEPLSGAILARLRFRAMFLDAAWFSTDDTPPNPSIKVWRGAFERLAEIKSSHELGSPVPEAFSAKLQQKLASTIPPRPIVELEFEGALTHLERLFQDGAEAIGVLEYTDSQCLLNFVSTFQAKKPQPLVFVRTMLQSLLFSDMQMLGSMSIRQIIDDDFAIVCMPASILLQRSNDEIEAVHDPRFVISQQMEQFRQKACLPFLDILRTFCQNRCRVRRTLCHGVRAWDSLQVDAEELDEALLDYTKERSLKQAALSSQRTVETYSLPLSSWTYLYKLRQMELIVQLGFELEIHQPDELAGMYWYLNYLAKTRLQHLGRIKSFVSRRADEVFSRADPDTHDADQVNKSLSYLRVAMLDAVTTWQLADAFSIMFALLNRHHALPANPRPYSNDKLRYELRMRPFCSIGIPELPDFDEFDECTRQSHLSSTEMLGSAEAALNGAKAGLEVLTKMDAEESFSVGSYERWLADARGSLKACIAAGLVLVKMRKAVKEVQGDASLKVRASVSSRESSYHAWWIVPRLVQGA